MPAPRTREASRSALFFLTGSVALVLVACPGKHESQGSGTPVHVSVPAADARAPTALAPDATVKASALTPLPDVFRALGQFCNTADSGARVATVMCSARGRVVGVWVPVDTVSGVPPEGAEIVRREPRQEFAPGRFLVVALEGERLWIQLVSCGACRRVMGASFVGQLPQLSDEQLRVVQDRVGLPAAPLLTTPAAWRKAYKDRPLPPLPDGATPFNSSTP